SNFGTPNWKPPTGSDARRCNRFRLGWLLILTTKCKMKRFHVITILTTLFLFSNTSCSDFLDKMPDDQLTMEMIFTDKIRTEDWLASVYSSVPSPMWGYFKDQGFNIMGDDITIPQEWSQFGWANVYAYTMANWNPNSGWNPNYWVELPKRIRTGLIFLEQVRVIPE